MPPKINEGKVLRRELKVYGIEHPVVVTLDKDGIKFKAKGTKWTVDAPWLNVIGACGTPQRVPSAFYHKPYQLLQSQGIAQQKREAAKLERKIAKEIEEKQ